MSSFSFIFSYKWHTYTSTPYVFRNPKSESSTNPQTHYTKNNWPNIDNIIVMGGENWEEENIKKFTRLVKKIWENLETH